MEKQKNKCFRGVKLRNNSRELIIQTHALLNNIDHEIKQIDKKIKCMERKAKKEAPVNERESFLNGCKIAKQGVKRIQREVLKLRFKKPEVETIGLLEEMRDEIIRQRVAIDQIHQDIMRESKHRAV